MFYACLLLSLSWLLSVRIVSFLLILYNLLLSRSLFGCPGYISVSRVYLYLYLNLHIVFLDFTLKNLSHFSAVYLKKSVYLFYLTMSWNVNCGT